MTQDPLLIGLDIGTTNIKALVFTPNGTQVASASTPTPTHSPRPGWAYYEPEELWNAAVTVLRQVTEQVEANRIFSIAVASMGEAGVPLDAENNALYPAIAWYDSRTEPQAEWLGKTLGKDRIFHTTGLSLQPIFGLCKLLWLKENEADIFSKTVRWLNISEYIAFRLSGEQATEYSLASRTMALDIVKRQWADDILSEVGLSSDIYAPLVASGTVIGQVMDDVSQITGLPTSVKVATGGHDHVCGAFALGVTNPGMVLDSMGTAETIFLSLPEALTNPQLGREGYTQGAHVVPDLYYVFGSLYQSGGSIEWFRSTFNEIVDYDTLIQEAQAIAPGSHGVTFLPHLQLASSPFDDIRGRGAFVGLGIDVNRGMLFRSILEGIACDVRQILEAVLAYESVPPLETVFAFGGLTRNRLLMQIKATVLNRPINITGVSDAVSLGAAMLGGLGTGVYYDIQHAQELRHHNVEQIDPISDQVELYEQLYTTVYQPLYPAIKQLNHALHPFRQRNH